MDRFPGKRRVIALLGGLLIEIFEQSSNKNTNKLIQLRWDDGMQLDYWDFFCWVVGSHWITGEETKRHQLVCLPVCQSAVAAFPVNLGAAKTSNPASHFRNRLLARNVHRPRTCLPGTSPSPHSNTLSFEQIELLGTVSAISELDTTQSGGGGWSLTISDAAPILSDCRIGDSIAVNGCCLTVTEFDATSFKVGLAPETLSRTNLGVSPPQGGQIFFYVLSHFFFLLFPSLSFRCLIRSSPSRRSENRFNSCPGTCACSTHAFWRPFCPRTHR